MKFTSSGGKDAWNTAEYLNIWVCDLKDGPSGSPLGYAQLPEGYISSPATDGVVIIPEAFGRNSTALNYDLGDRKSTRLNPVTNAHLVCRLLLEKQKQSNTSHINHNN